MITKMHNDEHTEQSYHLIKYLFERESPEENVIIPVTEIEPEPTTIIHISHYHRILFTTATFINAGLGSGLWQLVDNFLNDAQFDEKFSGAYELHCLIVGCTQVLACGLTNELTARVGITDRWTHWTCAANFVNGIIWLPLVALGNYLSDSANEHDYNSLNSIAITTATVTGSMMGTLYLLRGFKYCIDKYAYHIEVSEKPVAESKSISILADSVGTGLFYPPGPLELPGSRSGMRSALWAALFCGGSTAIVTAVEQTIKACKYVGGPFWNCLNRNKPSEIQHSDNVSLLNHHSLNRS